MRGPSTIDILMGADAALEASRSARALSQKLRTPQQVRVDRFILREDVREAVERLFDDTKAISYAARFLYERQH